ncbi:MAG: hypothetical protein ACRC2U_12765 [Aeromonas sp.]
MILSSAEIAEEGLRQIGKVSPYDTAAAPEDFVIALRRLSLVIDFVVGQEILQFFEPAAQEITLAPDKPDGYDLNALLDTEIQYIEQIYIINPQGRGWPLELLRPQVFDGIYVPNPSVNGLPDCAVVTRSDRPIMRIFPNLAETGWKARITGRRFASNVTLNKGNTTHGFPASWQLGLIYMLGADIGGGPVTMLPQNERNELYEKGEMMLRQLTAVNARAQVSKPRFVKVRDF